MLRFEDFEQIGSIQASVFTPGHGFSSSRLLKSLLNWCGDVFDCDPIVLPLPEDAPAEIPRITLQNSEKSLKLELSPLRVNFFRLRANPTEIIRAAEFLAEANALLGQYMAESGAKCGRIAGVLTRYAFRDKPQSEIAEHFCKKEFLKEPFGKPSAFELHALRKYKYKKMFDVNSWVRIKSGQIKPSAGPPQQAVFAEQDINTFAELLHSKIFNEDEMGQFFVNLSGEFDQILRLYFPSS